MSRCHKYAAGAWILAYIAFGLYFAHNGTYLVTVNGHESAAPFWAKFVVGVLLLPGIGIFGTLLLLPFVSLLFSFFGLYEERQAGEQEKKDE